MSGLAALARGAAALLRRRAAAVLRPLAQRLGADGAGPPLAWWGLERGPDGGLALGGVALGALAAEHGTPLLVVDAARLAANAAAFTAPVDGAPVETFCSYKTNPVPGVLAALHARGLGAEVVSAYELWLALRLGVAPDRIVFNGPAKTAPALREALGHGVGLLNVNARGELAEVAGHARALGVRPRVGVRVAVPGTWGGQFGERIDTGAALETFREALARPELRVCALHAHPGEEIATAARLDAVLDGVLAFADRLHAELGLSVELLDLGGNLAAPTVSHLGPAELARALRWGIPPRPRDPAAVLRARDYVERVARRVADHFRAAGRPTPRVVLEPGRALFSDTQHLLTSVLQVVDGGPGSPEWAVLDAGINAAEPVRSEWHGLLPLRPRAGAPERTYRLAGPSCMKGDLLYPAARLPALAPGDPLVVLDAGAYFVPFSTNFSFPRAAVVAVEDGAASLLRQAETYEDMVARDLALAAPAGAAVSARRGR